MPWLDGETHTTSVVPFDLCDRGLLLGDGVFDTSLVLGGTMVWRGQHVERLVASCHTLGFAIDAQRIEEAIDATIAGLEHGVLRVTVTRGAGPRGIAPPKEPRPCVFASSAPLRAETMFGPLALHLTAIRRNETSPSSRVKSLSYLDSVLASREALAAGCDEALFLNAAGRVACTAVGNVMALVGDQIVTPPLEDGIVAGIARAQVLATCDELGLEAVERGLSLEELHRADALFVTSSLKLIAPVAAIDRDARESSSSRRVQALIAHLAALIRAESGVDPRRLAG
jgi:branched-chain amino acid aminotransferase